MLPSVSKITLDPIFLKGGGGGLIFQNFTKWGVSDFSLKKGGVGKIRGSL